MIDKPKIKWSLVLAFFLISISYFDIKYHFAPLKYIGLVIIDIIALKDVLNSGQMERHKATAIFAITFFFLIPVFLSGGVGALVNALIYGVQLGIIIFYSGNILRNPNDYLSIALGGILSMVMAFILDFNKVLSQMSYSFGRVRVCGAFMHPNTFGAVALSVFACLFVYLALRRDELRFFQKLLCYAAICGCVYAAVLSDSNNALIGILLFFLLLIVYKTIEVFSIPEFIAKLIMVVLIIVFGYQLINSFDEDLMASLTTRVSSFEAISNMPFLKLILGYGISGGGDVGIGWGAEFSLTQLIYKTGIAGVMVYVLIFGGLYLNSRHTEKKNKHYVECLIVVFLVCSIVEPYITNITNILPMYFLIMISSLANKSQIGDLPYLN